MQINKLERQIKKILYRNKFDNERLQRAGVEEKIFLVMIFYAHVNIFYIEKI